ncbi:sensor histidine kinase [Saccharopolyspora sp. 5N102]|uniref:sensor histidine kinase n=1 Tax=Saccharopolyspora sp. 5N102 TaxID=3375155 RepID=UPI0037942B99
MLGNRLVLLDAALGVAISAAYVSFAMQDGADGLPVFTGPAWLGWLIAAAVGLPVAVRGRWPLPVLAVVLVATTAATLLDITREPCISTALALHAVGRSEPLRRSAPAVVTALLTVAIGLFLGEAVLTPTGNVADIAGLVGAVWLLAGGAWGLGAHFRQRDAFAEHEIRRVRAEERLRIAREMHDIVSHNLSLIAVQAGVANHIAEQRPAEAREALRSIEEASRSSLLEMRGMLGVLRSAEPLPHEPVPGLAALRELADRAIAAGVSVDLEIAGAGHPPAGVELAVYRIVQESLTNVVKHAAPARCTVRVDVGADAVGVFVVDDGTRAGRPGDGHGLVGMRERVMMYGGEFAAGPRPGGGFGVTARLPCGKGERG